MRLVTIMKRAELTQKMIDMKMGMWEKMGDGACEDRWLSFEGIKPSE